MRLHGLRSQRGNVAATVVLFLAGLIATLGLAMNVGRLMSVRGELQNAADAAALSGAGRLDGSSAMVTAAMADAATYGRRNVTDGNAAGGVTVDVRPADVEVGHWGRVSQGAAMSFTKLDPATADPKRVNAVRVTTRRDASRGGGPVDLFFSAFLGNRKTADVGAIGTAVRGGPTHLACMTLPIAISNCEFTWTCERTEVITWSTDGTDEVAWTEGIIGNVNTSDLVAILKAIGPADDCKQPLSADTWITVNNGVKTDACRELQALWMRYPGRRYYVPKVYVEHCPEGGTAFHQDDYPIEEFVAIEITGVCCKGPEDLPTCGAESPDGKSKYMKLVMHCGVPPPPGASGTGGGFTSISPQPPGLAQ